MNPYELPAGIEIQRDFESNEDSLLMRLFLDFASTEALKNNTLQPYTTQMSETAHQLIEGVQLDDE
ncbi:hypothetical protein [Trichormus sp. NMC-1]|uniref:hypothetical protein n=1 Tax=Trichormus sp. NMC-1 TaxID=1853259 RepID=UPI0008DC2C48|nr:hypothetical protein [Trichormus sp. NMC-1]